MAKRKCDQVVRPPSSYEEYLKLSKKDKLRLMKQNAKTIASFKLSEVTDISSLANFPPPPDSERSSR